MSYRQYMYSLSVCFAAIRKMKSFELNSNRQIRLALMAQKPFGRTIWFFDGEKNDPLVQSGITKSQQFITSKKFSSVRIDDNLFDIACRMLTFSCFICGSSEPPRGPAGYAFGKCLTHTYGAYIGTSNATPQPCCNKCLLDSRHGFKAFKAQLSHLSGLAKKLQKGQINDTEYRRIEEGSHPGFGRPAGWRNYQIRGEGARYVGAERNRHVEDRNSFRGDDDGQILAGAFGDLATASEIRSRIVYELLGEDWSRVSD